MRSYVYFSIIGALGGWSLLAVNAADQPRWQTAVRWHRSLNKALPGTLVIDNDGIEFQSRKLKQRWAFVDIHTFDTDSHELTLWTYQRRPYHEPGERPFRFTLSEAIPLDVAALLSERVEKPVRNGVPLAEPQAVAEIPAHRRTWFGGSNGTLRLNDGGIDYVTEERHDSRSWRWSDIQTIANPNPYELRVTAYREIVEFDLKQALPRATFERMWDELYASDLNLFGSERGERR
jgi:hypothetical protein